jgi:F0F1-type ATP synthase epsilon subunit
MAEDDVVTVLAARASELEGIVEQRRKRKREEPLEELSSRCKKLRWLLR